jgi:acyl-homoserine lactone acylase PvdQ
MTGATMPGMSFFFSGTNGRFSWAWSKVNVDSVDLYLEDFHQGDNRSYVQERDNAEILVRDSDKVNHPTFKTNNGQAISGLFYKNIEENDTDKSIVTARYPFPDKGYKYFQSLVDLHLCPTLHCAAEALQKMDGLPSDYLLVDNKDIIHVVSGSFPVRNEEGSGNKIRSPFNETSFNWGGYLPFSEKPKEVITGDFYVAGSTNKLY